MEKELSLWRWSGSLIYENAANFLTAARIWIVVGYLFPCFFLLGMNPWDCSRFFWLVAIAALTDLFDGIVARWTKSSESGDFGKHFDKIADKICEVGLFSVIITMIIVLEPWWLALFFIPIVRIELLLVAAWIYGYRNGKDASAGKWGKRKMALYFFLCCFCLMPQIYWNFLSTFSGIHLEGYFYPIFAILLAASAVLAELSLWGYVKRYE